MKIYIKYMVSNRCKMAVREVLRAMNLHFVVVDLGVVDIMEDLSPAQIEEIRLALSHSELELMDDKRGILIEKIKNIIIEMVHHDGELPKMNFSNYLSEKLSYDYTYL